VSMEIKIETVTYKTFSTEQTLKSKPQAYPMYRADCDEEAANEARPIAERMIVSLRGRVKDQEAPVEWRVDRREDDLVVRAAIVLVTRANG